MSRDTCEDCRYWSMRRVEMPLPPDVTPLYKVEHMCSFESGALVVRATLPTGDNPPASCRHYSKESRY